MHATLSGHDYAVMGGTPSNARGRLVEAFVTYPTALPRHFCQDVGLPQWEPGG